MQLGRMPFSKEEALEQALAFEPFHVRAHALDVTWEDPIDVYMENRNVGTLTVLGRIWRLHVKAKEQ